MKFSLPLIPGTLIKRYKRFLADIKLEDGTIITAHCPNSGSMLTCNTPDSPLMLSYHNNPNRKYPYSWEMVKVNSSWVGINTMIPNKLVAQSIEEGLIPELTGYEKIITEIKVSQHSRLDLMLEKENELCYIEIKNVSLVQDGVARFPDAVTKRGTKHLRELIKLKEDGNRAVIFFLIQRQDGKHFAPADNIDPEYGKMLREAVSKGVEILPYRAIVNPGKICIDCRLDFNLS
ncbi:DNA/RNA nuclease SfsA [candidate division KSB1 bacterium]|nr:DNA/RNA nuclease SfsA [candidate division KSB1 bacterium]MBL7093943.1 DNA/RNA nuclease SfsA [candidate division KSB1 bacterium]